MEFGDLRLRGDPQRVLVLLVAETSPRGRGLREDHRPLILAGNHLQTVSTLVERLAFDRDRIGERDGGIFVGSGAPNLSVRHEFAPDLAVVHQRPMIVDSDVGKAKALRDHGMLALPRQIEHYGLGLAKTGHREKAR